MVGKIYRNAQHHEFHAHAHLACPIAPHCCRYFSLTDGSILSLTSWAPTRGGIWWESYGTGIGARITLNYSRTKRSGCRSGARFLIVGIAVPLEFLLGSGYCLSFPGGFRGKGIFHTITLTPMMVVPAVAGYMFFMLFQIEGPINAMLSMVTGLDVAIPWLSHQYLSVVSVIIADVWQWTPLMFLILLSGLLAVPEDQLKAATILGASFWQKFRYLMWPIMKPVVIIALVLRFMEAIKIFDSIMLMTAGGPARATETISVYMYKIAFQNIRWSYAAAAAIVILVIMTIVATYALKPLQAGQADDEF